MLILRVARKRDVGAVGNMGVSEIRVSDLVVVNNHSRAKEPL